MMADEDGITIPSSSSSDSSSFSSSSSSSASFSHSSSSSSLSSSREEHEVKPLWIASWTAKHPCIQIWAVVLIVVVMTVVIVVFDQFEYTDAGNYDFLIRHNPDVETSDSLNLAETYVYAANAPTQALQSIQKDRWTLQVMYEGFPQDKRSSEKFELMTEQNLRHMRAVESKFTEDENYPSYCLLSNGSCVFFSVTDLFLSRDTEPVLLGDIPSLLEFYASQPDIFGFFFDRDFSSSSRPVLARSMFMIGAPIKNEDGVPFESSVDRELEQYAIFSAWAQTFVEYYEESAPSHEMNVVFFGGPIVEWYLSNTVTSDLLWAFASICFVGLYMAFHTGSGFLAVMGMIQIFVAFPISFFIYRIVFQINFFQAIHIMSVFLMLGIGSDEMFVFHDAWEQAEHERGVKGKDIAIKLAWVYRRANNSIFATSSTSAVAFISTSLSKLVPISFFGIFCAILTIISWALVMTFYGAAVIVWTTHSWTKCGCCFFPRASSLATITPSTEQGDDDDSDFVASSSADADAATDDNHEDGGSEDAKKRKNKEKKKKTESKKYKNSNRRVGRKGDSSVKKSDGEDAGMEKQRRTQDGLMGSSSSSVPPGVVVGDDDSGILVVTATMMGSIEEEAGKEQHEENGETDDHWGSRSNSEGVVAAAPTNGEPSEVAHEYGGRSTSLESSREKDSVGSSQHRVWESFFHNVYTPALIKCRFAILIFFLFLFVAGIVGTTQIRAASSDQSLFPSGHPVSTAEDLLTNGFVVGENDDVVQVHVFWGVSGLNNEGILRADVNNRGTVIWDDSFDITEPEAQAFIVETCEEALRLGDTAVDTTKSWHCLLNEFSDWRQESGESFPVEDPAELRASLAAFLDPSNPETAANAAKFDRDLGLVFETGEIKYIQLRFYTSLVSSSEMSKAEEARGLWVDFMKARNRAASERGLSFVNNGKQTAHIAWSWIFSAKAFARDAIESALLSLVLSFIILTLTSHNLIVSLMASISVLGIVSCVLGFMAAVSYTMGVAEAIAVSLVVGFSVDYVCHLALAYAESVKGPTRSVRVLDTATSLGVTVIGGALTTIGSSIFLLPCTLVFFTRFAVLIVATILFSLLWSLGFFLALLATVGPQGHVGNVAVLTSSLYRRLHRCVSS